MIKQVLTCAQDDPVIFVAQKMIDHDVGLLVVVEDNLSKHPVGVITDRDLIERVVLKKLDPSKTVAGSLMTKKVVSVQPEASIAIAADLMKKNKLKRLIVVDSLGNLAGIISNSDFLKHFLDIRKQLLDFSFV